MGLSRGSFTRQSAFPHLFASRRKFVKLGWIRLQTFLSTYPLFTLPLTLPLLGSFVLGIHHVGSDNPDYAHV